MLALPVAAQEIDGDPEAGAREYRKCKACHSIEGSDGAIQRGDRTGPNLYGIVNRVAGSYEDFAYSDLMVATGEQGLQCSQEDLVGYVADPTSWLRDYTGEPSGRGKMAFKLRDEDDAKNDWAYLASVGPDPEADGS